MQPSASKWQIFWFVMAGAIILMALSTAQKFFLGGPSLAFNPKSYIVPFSFGSVSGLLLGLWQYRLRQSAARIQSSESQFRLFSDVASDFVFWKTPAGALSYVSPACERLTGYSPQELLTKPALLDAMIHPEDHGLWDEHDQCRRNSDEIISIEHRIVTKSGQVRWIQHVCGPVYDETGACLGIRGSNTDITRRVLMEQELRESEHRYFDLLENANDLIQSTLPDGKLLFANRAWREALGYAAEEIPGLHLRQIIHPDTLEHWMSSFQGILSGKTQELIDAAFITKDGRKVLIEGSVNCRFQDGQPISTRGIFRDVTARKAAEEKVRRLAYYDTLTNLPNRDLFRDRLERSLSRARRAQRTVAVAFLDLDRFKNINDSLGHAYGDLLLQEVACRLTVAVRETDTVSRFGGDEFVILMADMSSRNGATVAANKLLNAFTAPFVLDGVEVSTTTSIGLAVYPDSGEDADTLLKHADVAMYQAKNLGRNTFQFYSQDMNAQALKRLLLGNDLRHALEKDELFLLYQPQLDVASGRMIGVEALLRWRHATQGVIAPDQFIPVAEETGLIIPIGRWVLQAACRQFKLWLDQGCDLGSLAVNLSPKQFKDAELAAHVTQALGTVELPPYYLELELTESMLMEHAGETRQILQQLRQIGVRLAIDDFGTGYSSLSYLKHFPINKLKIDKSFVAGLPDDRDDAAIAEAIVGLSRSLDLQVLAEGVETEAQRDCLERLQCHHMQGYYFSRPVEAQQITQLLQPCHATLDKA